MLLLVDILIIKHGMIHELELLSVIKSTMWGWFLKLFRILNYVVDAISSFSYVQMFLWFYFVERISFAVLNTTDDMCLSER